MIALVLCAGLGTRFRPATLATPKPLLALKGRPILFHLLDHLLAQGAEAFVLNAHHLGEKLHETVGDAYEGCPVRWSFEDPILGTAGAIRRAAEQGFLGEQPFVVVNGDVYTTLGLGRLLQARQKADVICALAVVKNTRPVEDTPLWADEEGQLVAVGGERPRADATGPWLFTGIQSVKRALPDRIPPGYAELARDVLRPSLARGERCFALVPYRVPEEGVWFDLGTPERLAAAEAALTSA